MLPSFVHESFAELEGSKDHVAVVGKVLDRENLHEEGSWDQEKGTRKGRNGYCSAVELGACEFGKGQRLRELKGRREGQRSTKGAGHAPAHLLRLTSGTLRPKRLKS
jgi:hypothetical protein